MNKRIILISVLTVFMCVFLWVQSGIAYMIEDETLVKAYNVGSEYNGTGSSGTDYSGWVDVVGDKALYDTYGIDISIDSSYLYFDIYTNFPEIGDGWITPADLFFSIYGFNYGVVLTDHQLLKQGEVYSYPTYITSYDVFVNEGGWIYGGKYDKQNQKDVPVLITGGQPLEPLAQGTVKWAQPSEAESEYRIDVNVPLTDIFPLDLDISQIDVLFGTAICGNDVITGSSAPVPEPATMLLFGTGLLGLVGIGRKKFRTRINTDFVRRKKNNPLTLVT